jgi:hypothetical protein
VQYNKHNTNKETDEASSTDHSTEQWPRTSRPLLKKGSNIQWRTRPAENKKRR